MLSSSNLIPNRNPNSNWFNYLYNYTYISYELTRSHGYESNVWVPPQFIQMIIRSKQSPLQIEIKHCIAPILGDLDAWFNNSELDRSQKFQQSLNFQEIRGIPANRQGRNPTATEKWKTDRSDERGKRVNLGKDDWASKHVFNGWKGMVWKTEKGKEESTNGAVMGNECNYTYKNLDFWEKK